MKANRNITSGSVTGNVDFITTPATHLQIWHKKHLHGFYHVAVPINHDSAHSCNFNEANSSSDIIRGTPTFTYAESYNFN